jgi:hypothetical protein
VVTSFFLSLVFFSSRNPFAGEREIKEEIDHGACDWREV